jgi:protein RecA
MGTLEELSESLLKNIGGNAGEQTVKRFLDTGFPPLNKIISPRYNGGLPYGRIIEMFGESSTGKTALATAWMVEAQKLGGVAGFIDWERSFDVNLAKSFGLNDQRPFWIYTKLQTWEEGNIIAVKACQLIRESKAIPDDAPILFVFDSIASALPKSMTGKAIDEYSMNDTTALARVTSTTLKAMAHHCEEFGAIFLYLNQVRLKPGVSWGDPRVTPGGKAMEFFASVRLALSRRKITDTVDGEKKFIGQEITVQCVKSKLTKPFQETSLIMSFDDMGVARFDTLASLLNFVVQNKLVEYAKPRIVWTDGKKYFAKELLKKLSEERDGFAQLVALLTPDEE